MRSAWSVTLWELDQPPFVVQHRFYFILNKKKVEVWIDLYSPKLLGEEIYVELHATFIIGPSNN